MSRMKIFAAALGLAAVLSIGAAFAADPESCKKVRLSDVGWTDIQATTGVASVLLTALGYEPEVIQLSVPVTYASLKNNDLDVFLGNWMPSMTADIKEYTADGSVETISQNLDGAGYGLVVPTYMAEAGVKTLADLAKPEIKEKLDGKVYGIEAGNDGNRIILDMIGKPDNGLAGYELVESSEAGMLTQAEQSMKDNEWIVFLGWTPHPVMGEMKISLSRRHGRFRLRRRDGAHQRAQGLRHRVPERRQVHHQPEVRSVDGKHHDGRHPQGRQRQRRWRRNG